MQNMQKSMLQYRLIFIVNLKLHEILWKNPGRNLKLVVKLRTMRYPARRV